jgi:hypothetical protein
MEVAEMEKGIESEDALENTERDLAAFQRAISAPKFSHIVARWHQEKEILIVFRHAPDSQYGRRMSACAFRTAAVDALMAARGVAPRDPVDMPHVHALVRQAG